MTTQPVTMTELELEHRRAAAEPGDALREQVPPVMRLRFSFTQIGYGNTAQSGLVNVAVGNGSLNNIASLGSGNIL